jgi:hypothetical protein
LRFGAGEGVFAGCVLLRAAGAVMILMGMAMMTGHLSALSYWLLDAFPGIGPHRMIDRMDRAGDRMLRPTAFRVIQTRGGQPADAGRLR